MPEDTTMESLRSGGKLKLFLILILKSRYSNFELLLNILIICFQSKSEDSGWKFILELTYRLHWHKPTLSDITKKMYDIDTKIYYNKNIAQERVEHCCTQTKF